MANKIVLNPEQGEAEMKALAEMATPAISIKLHALTHLVLTCRLGLRHCENEGFRKDVEGLLARFEGLVPKEAAEVHRTFAASKEPWGLGGDGTYGTDAKV